MSSSSSKPQYPPVSGEVYAVGTGPVGLEEEQNITHPLPIETLRHENITKIASGNFHTLALDENKKMWSWGSNRYGALGRDFIPSSIPARLNHPSILHIKFEKIACGKTISMAVSTKGLLYTWGTFTYMDAVIGYLPNTKIQTYPRIVHSLAKKYILAVAAGVSHCLALTSEGQVYSWGSSKLDILGRPVRDEYEALVPNLIRGLSDIVSVTCGAHHSFAVDKSGHLFAWGWNHYQQCGLVKEASEPLPKNTICQPTMIPYFAAVQQSITTIKQEEHTDNLSVYGTSFVEPLKRELEDFFPTRSKIKSVSAGESHTIVLMSDNSLIAFGRCDRGQLGLELYSGYHYRGSIQSREVMFAIGYPTKQLWRCKELISEVVCGDNHTLILTQEGHMYGFGYSADCQLGLYIHQVVSFPTFIESMQKKRAITASAGDRFSMFIVS